MRGSIIDHDALASQLAACLSVIDRAVPDYRAAREAWSEYIVADCEAHGVTPPREAL